MTCIIQPMVRLDIDKKGFAERLNKMLDAANVSKIGDGRQGVLAKKYGVSQNGARKWLLGEAIPRYETILRIIEDFNETGVTFEWLVKDGASPLHTNKITENPAEYNVNRMEAPAWRVPVVSWVSAGSFAECIDNYPPGVADEWCTTTQKPKAHTFALRVKGDSMEPHFMEGTLIVVEPDLSPEPNDYVIVKNGEDATFKQLVRDGSDYYLKPANDRYPIKPLGDGIIIGVVRESVRRYR